MTKSPDGAVAIVTGSAMNIGRAIAVAVAELGFDVLVHARANRDAAEETAGLVEAAGRRAQVHLGDLTDPEAAEALVQAAHALGPVGVLVNNAALRRQVAFTEMDYQEWRAVLAVNLDAAFLASRACIGDMLAQGWGRIINIGGLTGHTGAASRAHVVASKAALVGLTKALAVEFASQGVTANCVVPGEIDTVRGAAAGVRGLPPGKEHVLVGRRGRPDEVAAVVTMLCGPESSYLTGQTLHVSGGAYMP